jgi:hypothetical protein
MQNIDLGFLTEANWPKKASASSAHAKELHDWLGKLTNVVKNLVDRVEILENDKTTSEQRIKELILTKEELNLKLENKVSFSFFNESIEYCNL